METTQIFRSPKARWTLEEAAARLGFNRDEMSVLVRKGVLKDALLGNPSKNAPKHFSAVRIEQMAVDHEFLSKAEKIVTLAWRIKNRKAQELRQAA